MPGESFLERWERATEQLQQEHSLDGFLKMHENGEVSSVELFGFAYKHWHDFPDVRTQFLSALANHENADIQEVAERLSNFISKYH